MKVLITSNSHENYNETGIIVKEDRDGTAEVKLDRSGKIVVVPSGQMKITKIQS